MDEESRKVRDNGLLPEGDCPAYSSHWRADALKMEKNVGDWEKTAESGEEVAENREETAKNREKTAENRWK